MNIKHRAVFIKEGRMGDEEEEKWPKDDGEEEESNTTCQVPWVTWKPKKEMNGKVD